MHRNVRTYARRVGVAVAGVFVAVVFTMRAAQAGHESPFYPSFYPQEIRIETLDPAAAAAGWQNARVQAYVGDGLFAEEPMPADAVSATSLDSYVVLTFDAAYGRYAAASIDKGAR